MNGHRFDSLLGAFAASRRTLLSGTLAVLAGWLGVGDVVARKKRHKQKKKIKRNGFGCVDVGGFCRNSGQCCSGICQGKKDKEKCRAHNASTCQPGQDICRVGPFGCLTETRDAGLCGRTTGAAGYCEASAGCFPCNKDADCVPFCGTGAACLDCPSCALQDEGGITACVGQSTDSCSFPL